MISFYWVCLLTLCLRDSTCLELRGQRRSQFSPPIAWVPETKLRSIRLGGKHPPLLNHLASLKLCFMTRSRSYVHPSKNTLPYLSKQNRKVQCPSLFKMEGRAHGCILVQAPTSSTGHRHRVTPGLSRSTWAKCSTELPP